ncbi:hypothetical protein BST99_02310 [Aureicoccus marinus]|uniref:3-keto-alpha-glucoside-1,2-lyase/3-keto-2-hydroxy-glucal hydratase domain-containing protein n=2 Tax=Aureicoccus marinus TaxID=754435 RepID=A0A2S7T471_9FLAO|nr:hypothetical protein BST99_02310 [Aureicoccus marinus]
MGSFSYFQENFLYMKSMLLGAAFLCFGGLIAQDSLQLADLSSFKSQAGNWQIVGGVEIHPFKDIHDKAPEKKKRRWWQKKNKNKMPEIKALSTEPGTGILINLPSEGKQDALITNWEHGDLMLELEVMMPKGSNSGIYLQGRYEVQLYDSWGVQYPKFSDIGGIYRNWENAPETAFAGIAPSANPARPPGVWQQMKIHFRAPRFNDQGQKTENARFVYVELNGVPMHENVEVPHATGGPISQLEVASGPLMIQGDHGEVAFRNIKYTRFQPATASVSDLTFKAYHGTFNSIEELDKAEVVYEGKSPFIDVRVAEKENNYGLIYEGILHIDQADEYSILAGYGGGARLTLNGKVLDENNTAWSWGGLRSTTYLEPGRYPFKLETIKAAGWWPPVLGFSISTKSTEPVDFHTEESFSRLAYIVPRILVEPEADPKMLRGFVRFEGEKLKSHTMGVGTPEGVHYVYDLESGHVLGMWRGYFVDATPMWRDRGNGSFNPQGDVNWTFDGKGFLNADGEQQFRSTGYSVDAETRLPIFHGKSKHLKYAEKITPNANGTGLQVQMLTESIAEGTQLSQTSLPVYVVAQGKIESIEAGLFKVNERYYIKTANADALRMVEGEGNTQMLTFDMTGTLTYEILW